MLEICKMLTISTAHITKETADMLSISETDLIVYDKDEYGWWIAVCDIDLYELSGVPDDLAACVRLAMQNGCEWLCLDCDGEVVDCLPTYEWE